MDNVAAAALLLEEGAADIEAATKATGETALHWAARAGSEKTLELLLHKNAAVKARNKDGLSPLDLAAPRGTPALLQQLIAAGAEVNETVAPFLKLLAIPSAQPGRSAAARGVTRPIPLLRAAWGGNHAAVALLLEQGADVNDTDDADYTALHLAASGGELATVNLLLEKGAAVNSKANGYTPLMFAATQLTPGGWDLSRAGFGTAPRESGNFWRTGTYRAPIDSRPVAALLVEKGADVNALDALGRSALSLAVQRDDMPLAEWLLAHGANTSILQARGNQKQHLPLHAAAQLVRPALVELLLKRGAPVNAEDAAGRTALDVAMQNGVKTSWTDDFPFASLYAFDPQMRREEEARALGDPTARRVVQQLLEAAGGRRGSGAFFLTIHYGATAAARRLLTARPALARALCRPDGSLGHQVLIDANPAFNQESPLLQAIAHGERSLILTLLEAKTPPDGEPSAAGAAAVMGVGSAFPLLRAVEVGDDGAASLLLACGANINIADKDGNTALHIAARREELTLLALLLDGKANPTLKNKAGRTPLQEATVNGKLAAIDFLRGRGVSE